jgi:hypothetical protein
MRGYTRRHGYSLTFRCLGEKEVLIDTIEVERDASEGIASDYISEALIETTNFTSSPFRFEVLCRKRKRPLIVEIRNIWIV